MDNQVTPQSPLYSPLPTQTPRAPSAVRTDLDEVNPSYFQRATSAEQLQSQSRPGSQPAPSQQQPQNTANQPQQPATPPVNDEPPSSTQSTLLISELRDNLVIMKDGSFRAVVAAKSINYDLMSETEREGVEYSYQNFLNSLNFTTQILIRSQRIDITPYLERLTTIRRNNDNMLLGILMDDYINFIDILSQEANIMDKSFFIVIPYYSSPDAEKVVNQVKTFGKGLFRSKTPEITRIDRPTYEKATTEINNRVETVVSGLFQMGIHAIRLDTRQLGELYYNFYNPDTAVREPLVDFNKLGTIYTSDPNRQSPKQQQQPQPFQNPFTQGGPQNG